MAPGRCGKLPRGRIGLEWNEPYTGVLACWGSTTCTAPAARRNSCPLLSGIPRHYPHINIQFPHPPPFRLSSSRSSLSPRDKNTYIPKTLKSAQQRIPRVINQNVYPAVHSGCSPDSFRELGFRSTDVELMPCPSQFLYLRDEEGDFGGLARGGYDAVAAREDVECECVAEAGGAACYEPDWWLGGGHRGLSSVGMGLGGV